MNDVKDGVRGEVSEYTWGRLWADGTKEFNNGAIQYADGSLQFDGLTFYPDGVVIDAMGQQVGLAEDEQLALPEAVVEEQENAKGTIDEGAASVDLEEVESTSNETDVDEAGELIIEDENDVESYILPAIDER